MAIENKMKIALASAPFPSSIEDGLQSVEAFLVDAGKKDADIICFPESFLPGMRGIGIEIEAHNPIKLKSALADVCQLARENSIHVIIPMDWDLNGKMQNVAYVISDKGVVLGMQTKNQLDPSEEETFVAGSQRFVFDIMGIKIGIVICHEGYRYPESVRWAARNGAQIVFHPHCNGSDKEGQILKKWGAIENPYFEKAMMCRALENTIFFASVNYGFKYQESATSIINPEGDCIAHADYKNPGLLIKEINLEKATRLLAQRFSPEHYR